MSLSKEEIDVKRQAVIDEALSWQGTPHHNGAAIKGAGVDCGKFPWSVFHACGYMPPIPKELRYSHQFHLSRDKEWYRDLADQNGKRIEGPPLPGDFALYKIGRIFSHGAIVIKWPRIIHARLRVGVTQDDGTQGELADRDVLFYTMPQWVE
jgi:cell wall-associated NlpC family hydrolase